MGKRTHQESNTATRSKSQDLLPFSKHKLSLRSTASSSDTIYPINPPYYFGRRTYVSRSMSLNFGSQGALQLGSFIGLFAPVAFFACYEVVFDQGLKKHLPYGVWSIIQCVLGLLTLILFMRTSLSDPGFIAVPLTKQERRQLPSQQQKSGATFQLRYCPTCDIPRPLRTHHCRICDLCVKERDHHCPFLNNCIGLNNRRSYLLFLVCTVLLQLLIIVESIFQIGQAVYYEVSILDAITRQSVILAFLQLIYAIILGTNLLSLLLFQTRLVARNYTTDEFRRLFGTTKPTQNDINLNRAFDEGCIKNFKSVFYGLSKHQPIYSSYDEVSYEYLRKRFVYYSKKSQVQLVEEVRKKVGNKFDEKSGHHENDVIDKETNRNKLLLSKTSDPLSAKEDDGGGDNIINSQNRFISPKLSSSFNHHIALSEVSNQRDEYVKLDQHKNHMPFDLESRATVLPWSHAQEDQQQQVKEIDGYSIKGRDSLQLLWRLASSATTENMIAESNNPMIQHGIRPSFVQRKDSAVSFSKPKISSFSSDGTRPESTPKSLFSTVKQQQQQQQQQQQVLNIQSGHSQKSHEGFDSNVQLFDLPSSSAFSRDFTSQAQLITSPAMKTATEQQDNSSVASANAARVQTNEMKRTSTESAASPTMPVDFLTRKKKQNKFNFSTVHVGKQPSKSQQQPGFHSSPTKDSWKLGNYVNHTMEDQGERSAAVDIVIKKQVKERYPTVNTPEKRPMQIQKEDQQSQEYAVKVNGYFQPENSQQQHHHHHQQQP